MWCMYCFSTPHHPRCPKAPEPPVAFICDKCSNPVYEYEVDVANCYQTPDERIICGECISRMSARQALEYLGCITQKTPLYADTAF